MPASVYFDNYNAQNEQQLLEDLIVESINIYGHEVYYLPRRLENKDEIYEQSDIVSYNEYHIVPMYLENVGGFVGDSDFLSKFGIEIRNQIVLAVAIREFEEHVNKKSIEFDLSRPREGDLIYFAPNNKLFQIKYTDKFQMFYQLGTLQTWKLTLELFEYSGEKFNTGIEKLDLLEIYSNDLLQWAIFDEDGNYLVDESNNVIVNEGYKPEVIDKMDDSSQIQTESDLFVDFTVQNPFGEP